MLKNIVNMDIFMFADSKHGYEPWKKACYDKEEYGEPRGLEGIFEDLRTLSRDIEECLTIAYGDEDDD
jgi:hypothetical protein